jgi:hypothetical protein
MRISPWKMNDGCDGWFVWARTDILLLELTSKMALHEGGLAHTTIADKDELVSRNLTLHD